MSDDHTPFPWDRIEAFQLYCLTCSQNCGDTLYGLIWLMMADNTALQIQVKQTQAQSKTIQAEMVNFRQQVSVAEKVARTYKAKFQRLADENDQLRRGRRP